MEKAGQLHSWAIDEKRTTSGGSAWRKKKDPRGQKREKAESPLERGKREPEKET